MQEVSRRLPGQASIGYMHVSPFLPWPEAPLNFPMDQGQKSAGCSVAVIVFPTSTVNLQVTQSCLCVVVERLLAFSWACNI